jgi:hypothetical protein
LLVAFRAAEAIFVPKLLFRFDLFHLKDDLRACMTFLLKFGILALQKRKEKFKKLPRKIEETVFMTFSEVWNVLRIWRVEKKEKLSRALPNKIVYKFSTKLQFSEIISKSFGFNFHLQI